MPPSSAKPLSPMGQVALQYARRGWAVFPCRERDETFLNSAKKEISFKAKAPYSGQGFKDATRDEQRITAWWRQHPDALIGVPLGDNGCFVLDFDPRMIETFDESTGEVTGERLCTLVELKAALEEQMGVQLPQSLTSLTQSGGVHVWLKQPADVKDGGEPIRNRGNLPDHVDVRGLGGYVIAPPSVTLDADGNEKGRYSWKGDRGDWRDDASIAEAPPELIEILRTRGGKKRSAEAPPPSPEEQSYREACRLVIESGKASTSWLQRQLRLGYNASTRLIERMEREAIVSRPDHVGRREVLVDASSLPPAKPARSPATVSAEVEDDLRKYGLRALDGEVKSIRTAQTGKRNDQLNESAFKVATLVAAGVLDETIALSSIRAAARDNPGDDDDRQLEATINSGWTAGMQEPRDLGEIAAASRSRRERASSQPRSSRPRPPSSDDNGQPSSQRGGKQPDVEKEGPGPAELAKACATLPQTDLGNLERFLKRYGRDFLYVEAWGWLAWDGRRWNRDMAEPLLGRAIQQTMRDIQAEAELIRESGVPFPPDGGFPDEDPPEDRDDDDDMFARTKGEESRRKRKTVLWFRQKQLARRSSNAGERFDFIAQVKSNGDIVLFSDKIAAWGRTSEGAGHIKCIAGMAEARLSARPDDFDADPMKLNVGNGTLVFERSMTGGAATVKFQPFHRREDLSTKIAGCDYDPAALCPKYDAFIGEVQPDEEMRHFLDVWGGYSSLGLADAQKMAVFYGQGSNGKGVWVNTVAHILGDYAWAADIATFIDQGKYRKGSDASPDLAALSGRRMVYANEPEEGSKFSDGLIKAMTSDEPLNVRELLKPPFQLFVSFNNTVSANHRPKIGTDHGIQRRVQIVPWDVIIPDERTDLQLKAKLKAEASGILNRLVRGAVHYLTSGLPRPEAIVEATREYQEENDILGQFLMLSVARVTGETVGATPFHRVFAAWQAWASQLPASGKPWSPKYLNGQMQKKGFKITKSSTMQWQDIALRFEEGDFANDDGKPSTRPLPAPRIWPNEPPDHPVAPAVVEARKRAADGIQGEPDDGIPNF